MTGIAKLCSSLTTIMSAVFRHVRGQVSWTISHVRNVRRATPVLSALFVIGATAATPTYYCYGLPDCESTPPFPAVSDRHRIRITPQGTCQLDDSAVDCSHLGAQLRAAYPDSNPQIGICPSPKTSFAQITTVQQSLGKARLLCLDFDCNRNSRAWAPACRDLKQPTRIDVRVFADGDNCSVHQRQMRCEAVGAYLRDERHEAVTQYINLTVDGTGNSRERGQHVRDLIAKAGYTKIIVVGFITEPHQSPDTRP
jgi:biopolymer transport protein ExbD